MYSSLIKASSYLVKRAKKCNLHNSVQIIDKNEFTDFEIGSFLENDRKLRHIENPGKSLIYLATEFINLKPEMLLFSKLSTLKKSDYKNYIPDSVSEEKLRLVLVRFHNLQSLYDTYLSESDIELSDPRLKILRGHISFIYHMLKSATDFSHYYERHIVPRTTSLFFKSLLPIPVERFLEITINFFMKYFMVYFNGAIELCKDVIDCYAEMDEKDVPIPDYRGFHVRPSSLVSKIINYYGGPVKMIFNNMEYNPASPLELFRVNEEINAIKRKRLFDVVLSEVMHNESLKNILNELSKRGLVVIYDENFQYIEYKGNESYQEYLKGAFAFLLASGKIDIRMTLLVKFIGDKRSLIDIEILANSGYGEDKYGKNIPLPKKLEYLKR